MGIKLPGFEAGTTMVVKEDIHQVKNGFLLGESRIPELVDSLKSYNSI